MARKNLLFRVGEVPLIQLPEQLNTLQVFTWNFIGEKFYGIPAGEGAGYPIGCGPGEANGLGGGYLGVARVADRVLPPRWTSALERQRN